MESVNRSNYNAKMEGFGSVYRDLSGLIKSREAQAL
jgi:hypothetical protein